LRHCGLDLGLVGHIRYHGEICATCGNNGIERCAMTAEHGDGCARSFQDRRNLPADASTATSDERMRGMRQFDQAQPPSNAFSAYILYFKLLQQITRKQAEALLDSRGLLASSWPAKSEFNG
jgi:hypothetical protein